MARSRIFLSGAAKAATTERTRFGAKPATGFMKDSKHMNRQLNMIDATFLYVETKKSPTHIAGLQILDVPAARRNDFFVEMQRHVADRAPMVDFMTRRLVPGVLDLDHPHWETVDRLDVDHHVRRAVLPKPGSVAQLEELVARLHAQPLDRSKPLWQYYVIEGVEGNKVAWYTKMHHACIDGVAGQTLLDVFGNSTADDSPIGPKVADVTAPGQMERWARAIVDSALQPIYSLSTFGEAVRSLERLARRALAGKSFGAYAQRAPRTRFNGAIGPDRTLTLGTLSLSEVKAVGKAHGCKVNDVFMAVCAGGLRKYLADLHELPAEPLIAGVPVSLRELGDATMSNQVTMMLTSLETQQGDAMTRLIAIRDSTRVGKAIVAATSRAMPQDLHVLGLPFAVRAGMASMEALRLADVFAPPLNVVISNVPGPRHAVFIHGARMLTHHPVSVPAHGTALNITVQSYQDRLDFSLTACRAALADGGKLRDDMMSAWQELRAASRTGDAINDERVLDVDTTQSESAAAPLRTAA
jgi:WS/DGAT/MGAT family acyltransferase